MTPRRRVPVQSVPDDGRVVSLEWRAPTGRIVRPDTELSITGMRGRFRFMRHVLLPDGREWLDVVGGKSTSKGVVELDRAVRPDRVRTVHRTRTRGRAA